MIGKGLGFLVTLVSVFWLAIAGGWAVWKYERLPPGWPNYRVGFLIFHATIHAPGAGSVTALTGQLASLRAQEAAAARHAASVAAAQAAITAAASAHQAAVQTQIQWRTRTLIQQVPYAVPPSADPLLSNGWVRVHDAALGSADLSETAPASAVADAAASEFKSSAALVRVLGNYGVANSCRAQLIGLQDWLRQVEAAQ